MTEGTSTIRPVLEGCVPPSPCSCRNRPYVPLWTVMSHRLRGVVRDCQMPRLGGRLNRCATMPIKTDCLMDAAAIVAEQEEMLVSAKYAVGAGLSTTAASCAGSVAFGPVGMIAGAVVGSVVFTLLSRGKFKSLHNIIKYDLRPKQREELERLLVEAFKDFTLEEGLGLVVDVMVLLRNKKAYNLFYKVLLQFAQKYFNTVQRNSVENSQLANHSLKT